MQLTPVGQSGAVLAGGRGYKPAVGMWAWNPTFGEVRIETNGAIFRQAVTAVWDQARFEPQAAEGLQPVVCFVNRVPVPIKAVNKTFSGPVIKVIGWVEREQGAGLGDPRADRRSARGPAALGRLVGSSSDAGDACSQNAFQG